MGLTHDRTPQHYCSCCKLFSDLTHILHITGAKPSASWFGSGTPGLSHRTLVLALGLELLAVALNTRNLVCALTYSFCA